MLKYDFISAKNMSFKHWCSKELKLSNVHQKKDKNAENILKRRWAND